ncbi:MAG: galactokinase [Spirochaetes bacterium]|nr:galactokinase [Spirochaetota bacterium]
MNPTDTITERISSLHAQEYDALPDVIVAAPSIVRLLGEQLIETEGLYIALPLDMYAAVAISARKDTSVRFFSADINERKRTNLSNLKYKREDRWANLVKCAFFAFQHQTHLEHGYNITITGNIPHNLGFGASKALVCAAIAAVANLVGCACSPCELEKIALKLDTEYFERRAVLAEYTALVQARADSMLYIDEAKEWVEPLPYLFSDYILVFTDSKVPRVPIDNEIESRIGDFQHVVQRLRKGQRRLRDIDMEELDEYTGIIPESTRRHCMFMLEEIQRIRELREAAGTRDLAAAGRLINKSQAGLRNHYEISCPEVDWLIKRALEIDGVLASRMVGKGFGGCTLTIMQASAKADYLKRLEEYERIFGFKPVYWEAQCGNGLNMYTPSFSGTEA